MVTIPVPVSECKSNCQSGVRRPSGGPRSVQFAIYVGHASLFSGKAVAACIRSCCSLHSQLSSPTATAEKTPSEADRSEHHHHHQGMCLQWPTPCASFEACPALQEVPLGSNLRKKSHEMSCSFVMALRGLVTEHLLPWKRQLIATLRFPSACYRETL